MNNNKPTIAITMGDPAGNGPEITIKALSHKGIYKICNPIVIGDARALRQAETFVGRDIPLNICKDITDALFQHGTIDILHDDYIDDFDSFIPGKVSSQGGKAAFLSVKKAILLALAGDVDATCTNALNKEAMNMALAGGKGLFSDGHMHFDGHTEIYAAYTGAQNYTMMLVNGSFRVAHISTHCSLREACDKVRKQRILDVISLTNDALKDLGITSPRIAVAGLNPHAGENGLFGQEEISEIIPAIRMAEEEGIDVTGPIPPDTLFPELIGELYDAAVVMYHDQGHIPLKTQGFVYDREKDEWKDVEGVNVTLGLPIIRTSVDHGTGFSLVGTGKSCETSLCNAIQLAASMAQRRCNA